MCDRAAQDRAVEHAGQVEVVDVVALAAQESCVFLAQHAAEADGVSARTGRYLGDSHAVRPPGLSLLGGPPNGPHDVLVSGAATDGAADGFTDLACGRVRVAVEEGLTGHQHRRRAESALQAVLVHEALLDRAQYAALLEIFDRAHRSTVGHGGQDSA